MKETESTIKEKLAAQMMNLFDSVYEERKQYHADNPLAKQEKNIDSIIQTYSNYNAMISGGTGLIPGPWGMAAAVPEIVIILRNQLKMIYDIGMANGKQNVMNRDLLLAIFSSAVGTASIELFTMHGSKILIKRVSLRFMQKIVSMLAGKVTQQLLKSMVSKWLPVVGAIAMAAWSKYSTRKVGLIAKEFTSKNIEIDSEEIKDVSEDSVTSSTEFNKSDLELNKLKILINLMKVDKMLHEKEKEFLIPLINNSNLSNSVKGELIISLSNDLKFDINFKVFSNSPDEKILLIIDMIALSSADGKFHAAEKIYLKQVGKHLELNDAEIEELIADSMS